MPDAPPPVECTFDHDHPAASEPCESWEKLAQSAAYPRGWPGRDPQSEAYRFLVGLEGSDPDVSEETADALDTLFASKESTRLFSALFLESQLGSTGQFAALLGLRAKSSELFNEAAHHFEHSGKHFVFYPLWFEACAGYTAYEAPDLCETIAEYGPYTLGARWEPAPHVRHRD